MIKYGNQANVSLFAKDGNIWMNQKQLTELFDTSKPNVSMHISNILKERELEKNSVVKDYLTTASDGKQYNITFYSLDMILAIGFRVRSKRGTQFRIWANQNMNLKSWKGTIVRKQDIYTAKNYLSEDEIDTLNRLVVIFLESAELRVKNRIDITMNFWKQNVDKIIEFQDKKMLKNLGSISNEQVKKIVKKIYENFDAKRKTYQAELAEKQDFEELKEIEKTIKNIK